ncbi:protein phosphatase 1 regulatory subunit 14A-like [Strigops habroptila]|uniref:protein phosphatase 1 regulatory subunit 14A-like n=1 Tax=Strigops habroptila TaxID=2489341 RepID=UPI0011CF991A|nr:protein phosphatase 1 regulatory subunit 14A-like [Strigops habroptila]
MTDVAAAAAVIASRRYAPPPAPSHAPPAPAQGSVGVSLCPRPLCPRPIVPPLCAAPFPAPSDGRASRGATAGPGRGVPGGGSLGGGSPGRPPPAARSPALQRRPARATVKYNRRSCSGGSTPRAGSTARLQELYRGREEEMPDEVNIDELLELETDEERAQKLQLILKSCSADPEDFIQQLLVQLKGLPKQQLLQQPSPEDPPP